MISVWCRGVEYMDVYLRIPSTPLRCVSMWEKLYLTPHLWACKLLLKASRCNMEVLCRVAGDMKVLTDSIFKVVQNKEVSFIGLL